MVWVNIIYILKYIVSFFEDQLWSFFITGTTMQCDSMTQLVSGTTTPLLGSHEALESEIKRLRERLQTVEAENSAMSVKLNQQQWELQNRLAEIEMQICCSRSTSSLEDNERNRESII